ncbi:acyl transferase/acyl hydrolase/lysophospholipase [Flagelloscypha sp. PMI_526]|nr:acyl transferase/acyl hydrolase/lysophospholipase [Flagelloscypha sp. PMI_526]
MTTSDPVTLLALDSGGIRGLSEVEILHELVHRLQWDTDSPEIPKPCEHFDLIGGSGTGGLLAVLLGPLRLSTAQAKVVYLKIVQAAFSKANGWPRPPELILKDPPHLVPLLKDTVRDALQDEDARMVDPSRGDKCKVLVCLNMIHTHQKPHLIRTYETNTSDSVNYRIWEVLRAILSCPGVLSVFDPEAQTYTDMVMPRNPDSCNPSEIVLDEAFIIFPERRLSCLVNLGTGYVGKQEYINPIDEFVKNISKECDRAAEEMSKRARELIQSETELPQLQPYGHGGSRKNPSFYYRFHVEIGLQGFEHSEWEKQLSGDTCSHTRVYIEQSDASYRVDEIITDSLIGKKPRIVLRKREGL